MRYHSLDQATLKYGVFETCLNSLCGRLQLVTGQEPPLGTEMAKKYAASKLWIIGTPTMLFLGLFFGTIGWWALKAGRQTPSLQFC